MTVDSFYQRLEVSLPGAWVDHADRDYARAAHDLLGNAANQFNDAVVACKLIEPITASNAARDGSGRLQPSDPVGGRLRGIYARAYIYGLDAACSFVRTLMETLNEPLFIEVCNVFFECLRDVRSVRNSLAHVDERSQGVGSGGKRLVGPVVIIGGAFNGNLFGVTSGDGRHVEVEISEQYLGSLRIALLEIIWSFEWIVIGDIHARRP